MVWISLLNIRGGIGNETESQINVMRFCNNLLISNCEVINSRYKYPSKEKINSFYDGHLFPPSC